MTVTELLNWIIRAHDFQENSGFDEIKDQYKLCLKQSLEKCQPTEDQLGYDVDPGEMELAIAIAYTLSYGEILDMEADCYDRTPPKLERFNARQLSECEFPPPPIPYDPRVRLRPMVSSFEPFRYAQSSPDRAPLTPPTVERATRIQEELRTIETRAAVLEAEVRELVATETEAEIQAIQNRAAAQVITEVLAHEQAHSSNNGNQCSG